jgi:hypothetical protein
MSLTNFPNGITSFGIPLMGSAMPLGLTQVFFVDYGNGSDGVSTKANSASRPWKTIDKALDAVTTNKNEGIALMGSSTHTLTEMLDVSKNRVHMFGYDPGGRMYGQNAKVSLGITTAATDIGAIKNTGVRNSFRNIKFISNNTKDESLYTVVEAGEYAVYDFCEMYKSTDLNVTDAAELLMNGDSAVVANCTIGSNANALSGAVIRPCVMLAKGLGGSGKVSRDVTFIGCEFWRWAANTANAFVWWTSATDVERKLEFRNCLFNVTKKSTAVPAVAIGGTHALTAGEVLLTGYTAENGCTAMATQVGVFSCLPTYAAGGGSGIQAT